MSFLAEKRVLNKLRNLREGKKKGKQGSKQSKRSLSRSKTVILKKYTERVDFVGSWKGLMHRIVMIGTLIALRFICNFVKVALALPRPPPPEMLASLKAKLAAEAISSLNKSTL